MKIFHNLLVQVILTSVLTFFAYPFIYMAVMPYANELQALEGQDLNSKVLNVHIDGGGKILTRLVHIKQLENDDIDIVIDGVCLSACVMYLQSESACTTPRTFFMTHRAYSVKDNPMNFITLPISEHLGRRNYDDPLKDWLVYVETNLPKDGRYMFMGEDLIKAGWAKACENKPKHDEDYMNSLRDYVKKTNAPYISILTAPEFKGI